VAQLALAAIELALRAPDAAEIESQDREPAALEGLEQGINDLVVHGPPMLRVRMQHERDRGAALLAMLIAALDSSSGAVDNDFRHFWRYLCVRTKVTPGADARASQPLRGARSDKLDQFSRTYYMRA